MAMKRGECRDSSQAGKGLRFSLNKRNWQAVAFLVEGMAALTGEAV